MAKVIIRDEYYSCFQRSGSRVNYIKFDNLLEGWKKYKNMRSREFNYGDAWYEVSIRLCVPVRGDKPQRPHARSQWEWEDIMARHAHNKSKEEIAYLSEEEIAHLLTDFNVEDEDVMI